jgi:hypothetical protein
MSEREKTYYIYATRYSSEEINDQLRISCHASNRRYSTDPVQVSADNARKALELFCETEEYELFVKNWNEDDIKFYYLFILRT